MQEITKKKKVLFLFGGRANKILEPLKNSQRIIPVMAGLNSRSAMINFFKLLSAAKKNKVDILFTDCIGVMSLEIMAIAKLLRKPFVIRARGDTWREMKTKVAKENGGLKERIKRKLHIPFANLSLKKAHKIISVSEYVKKIILKNLKIDKDKIKVIPMPVAIPHKANGEVNQRDNKEVVNIGMIDINLNYRGASGSFKILSVFDEVLSEYQNAMVKIAGEGFYLKNLQDKIKELKNGKRIKTLGYVKDMEEFYKGLDIFVYVSFLDALPNSVLEAKGHGLSVIVNNFGGMKEQVQNGADGYIVKNKKELFNKIKLLIDDSQLRKQFGDNARKNVLAVYNNQRIGALLEKELLSL